MLAHMDFRPASRKVHIVHIRFDQLDAVPMRGSAVRCEAVSQYLSEIESFSLICHDDRNSLAWPAAAADVNLFFWVFLIAVYYGIPQSFAERQLDVELLSRNTLRSFNQSHQAIYSR